MGFSEVQHGEVSGAARGSLGAAGVLEGEGGRLAGHDLPADRVRLGDERPEVREQRGGLLHERQRLDELPQEVAPRDFAPLLRALAGSSAPLMRYEREMLQAAAREFDRLRCPGGGAC